MVITQICKHSEVEFSDMTINLRYLKNHIFNAFIVCCSNRIAIFVTAVKFTIVNITTVNFTGKQYKSNIR